MLHRIVAHPWFALADVVLVLVSGLIWLFTRELGPWFLLLALLPWTLRLLARKFPFQRTPLDGLIGVFLVTAWVGYWASYDGLAAWNKVWFVVLAVLLYYALSAQPKQNLSWISLLLFGIGVGVSLYYFLSHDFVSAPRKIEFVNQIGRMIMSVRPQVAWTPIHPNYVAGIVAVTVPFILYPIQEFRKARHRQPFLFVPLVGSGLALACFAMAMTTSRGVFLAIIAGAAGTWVLWKLVNSIRVGDWQNNKSFYSTALFLYLCAVILFLFAGPAQSAGGIIGTSDYGNGSRAELFSRSVYLALDFPFIGGGLGSFPGLYSQYLLNIPFYYLPNSHNLFLDVAIEQGMIGGLAFLLLYIAGIWRVSRSISRTSGKAIFQWIVLFSLLVVVIHGMVDDYLYNGVGAMISLLLIGLSMNAGLYEEAPSRSVWNPWMVSVAAVVLVIGLLVNFKQIRSIWYANLGSVQLAKVELDGFPSSEWAGKELVPKLGEAETSLHSAVQLDPANRTANHRLGLIAMHHSDFESAAGYLEAARGQTPKHRGIVKSLGYCYVWQGDFDMAQRLLTEIPEADHELEVYVWWWEIQGREDLSSNAAQISSRLNKVIHQP